VILPSSYFDVKTTQYTSCRLWHRRKTWQVGTYLSSRRGVRVVPDAQLTRNQEWHENLQVTTTALPGCRLSLHLVTIPRPALLSARAGEMRCRALAGRPITARPVPVPGALRDLQPGHSRLGASDVNQCVGLRIDDCMPTGAMIQSQMIVDYR